MIVGQRPSQFIAKTFLFLVDAFILSWDTGQRDKYDTICCRKVTLKNGNFWNAVILYGGPCRRPMDIGSIGQLNWASPESRTMSTRDDCYGCSFANCIKLSPSKKKWFSHTKIQHFRYVS